MNEATANRLLEELAELPASIVQMRLSLNASRKAYEMRLTEISVYALENAQFADPKTGETRPAKNDTERKLCIRQACDMDSDFLQMERQFQLDEATLAELTARQNNYMTIIDYLRSVNNRVTAELHGFDERG